MKTYKRIEDTGLYVDCNKLAERLYQVRFKMPKRDRAVLWELIFKNCGRDTPEGQAALAQIPASWGGLAEG